jgi:hypothetical protein
MRSDAAVEDVGWLSRRVGRRLRIALDFFEVACIRAVGDHVNHRVNVLAIKVPTLFVFFHQSNTFGTTRQDDFGL